MMFTSMREKLTNEEKYSFRYALHIMKQWRQKFPFTFDYLHQLDKPVAKVKTNYTAITPTSKNHALIYCYYQKLNDIFVRASVMLLQNYIVENLLMNGYMCSFVKHVYHSHMVPRKSTTLKYFAIVDFHHCYIMKAPPQPYPPNITRTWFTILVGNFKLERHFCNYITFPLWVSMFITIIKKSVSIRKGNYWRNVFITLPGENIRLKPCIELVIL